MRIKLLAAPLVLAVISSTAHAQVVAPSSSAPGDTVPLRDVSGTYTSTFGTLTLHQNGSHVVGNYTYDDGQIDGTFDGTTLSFTWRETNGVGFGKFVVASDGQMNGSWGINDDHSSGPWQATPAGAATPATDLTNPLDGGPHAGSLSFAIEIPWDGTDSPAGPLIGMGGIGIGIGKRLTDDTYLGVVGDWEALLGTSDAMPTYNRLRGGIEARYNFNHGTGSASINDGPAFPIPRTDWIGARAGVETLDGGTTHGEYAEVELGTDMWIGSGQFGMYISAGVSVEPLAAYGSTMSDDDTSGTAASEAPVDSSSMTTSGYFTLGVRLALG